MHDGAYVIQIGTKKIIVALRFSIQKCNDDTSSISILCMEIHFLNLQNSKNLIFGARKILKT